MNEVAGRPRQRAWKKGMIPLRVFVLLVDETDMHKPRYRVAGMNLIQGAWTIERFETGFVGLSG